VALETLEKTGEPGVGDDTGTHRSPENGAVENSALDTIPKSLSEVRSFWNVEGCGTQFVPEKKHSKEFYEKFRAFRYETEWHIPLLVPFAESRDRTVLEIGCGNGADGAMFASHGAIYTGVDLTEEAVESTRAHFNVLGLDGTFQIENAESLSFPDNSFDIVYSHGVLHHTVNPQQAIREVYRVLKPGGKAYVMLYHKNSFNYYIRVMGYMRARALATILPKFWRWKRDRAVLAHEPLVGVRGNKGAGVYQLHYKNFLKEGWSYFRPSNFVHHSTDGPECPFAYAYTREEARKLFSQFSDYSTAVAHFPLRKYGLTHKAVMPVERFIASRIGWYLFIYATK
jgi:ubiquinone/menaquinone biosynthesis C-methylase UbiE